MLAENLTIITLDEPHITDFAAKRNELLHKVTTDWVLFLDKDEQISQGLEEEIRKVILTHKHDAYYISRRDIFLGHELKFGETGYAKFIRLGRRSYGKWVRPVHELWEGRGNPAQRTDHVGTLLNPLIHKSHSSITSFLSKINYYSDLESVYRFQIGRRATLFHVFIYPLAKFKLNYLFRLGFLDGVPGLIHALMMSFHSYLTWSKLYLLCKKP